MRSGILLLVVAVFLGMLPKILEPGPKVARLVTFGAVLVGVIGIAFILLSALGMLGV